uniref:Uncharacterized protein n=1 Tax=Tanacetum cinerariifolium TaxID=118510 RepID=A0A6L2KT05_TANCI|nr:hypothetical protein [Tanacetum cinerariifolium]
MGLPVWMASSELHDMNSITFRVIIEWGVTLKISPITHLANEATLAKVVLVKMKEEELLTMEAEILNEIDALDKKLLLCLKFTQIWILRFMTQVLKNSYVNLLGFSKILRKYEKQYDHNSSSSKIDHISAIPYDQKCWKKPKGKDYKCPAHIITSGAASVWLQR